MTAHRQRLVSLWDMLQNYFPIYQAALELAALRSRVGLYADGTSSAGEVASFQFDDFKLLLTEIQKHCSAHDLNATAEMAERLLSKPLSKTYGAMFADLNHLDGSLGSELKRELVFRIPPDRARFFEQDELFGPDVAAAFPSCERDIRNAGSCYALGRADACVHHLMMVLERGLHALAGKVGVTYQRENWQKIIDGIEAKLKGMPRGPELDFCREVKAQFGFLKDAYRNHSEHAHDVPYDIPGALSILNHVRSFMQALEKGGLTE